MKNKKQVIFIEWSSRGRDFEIDLPLMYFFEKILNWEVQYLSIFNLASILKTNPNIVIMSNTTGAMENLIISRIIEKSNITFFSHVSEGMFKEIVLDGCLWGWNKEKRFSEIFSMLWSKKTYLMSLKYYPDLNNLKVSGSVGHDKYAIFNFKAIDKQKYKRVIGYAAFDFDFVFRHKDRVIKNHGQKHYELSIKDIKILNNILRTLITQNTDILFILKNHPGSGKKLSLELEGLDKYNNVMVVYDEYSILNVIANSDIWLNYRSSTNLEAWLLGKASISFCIDDCLLEHTEICYGSILENNVKKIQEYIDEFYQTDKIEDFEKKKELREKLISDFIGFVDGLNHIRFMSFLKPYIEKIENREIQKGKWNISLNERLKAYIKHIVYSVAKCRYNMLFFKKWAHVYDIFDDKEVEEQKKLRYLDFEKFYEKNRDKIDDIYANWYKNWKNELGIKE